jgi:N-acetylglucosaminyl-diphospho-decaprenol L-rhamnosyltransferase
LSCPQWADLLTSREMYSEPRATELTISIVTWNSARHISSSLTSVFDKTRDMHAEVIVVDNASTDGTPELVRRHGQARLLVNDRNVGFAAAHCQAWQAASGRLWLLLNPDATLQPGALGALMSFADRHPRAGLVSPRLIGVDGAVQHCAQADPSVGRTLLEASRLHRLLPRRLRARALLGSYFSHDISVPVGWTWGTALLARREAVAAVGALSDRFFMYGEDLEWCLRMRRGGWQVWFCADAEVRHLGAGSAAQRWSEAERRERILRGIDEAIRTHRGVTYTRFLKAAQLSALAIEAASLWLRSRPVGLDLDTTLRYHLNTLLERRLRSRAG